jgi:hypothetical protein
MDKSANRKDESSETFDVESLAKRLREEAEMMAIPIDFDQLVKHGVLKKKGRWWEVLDTSRLAKDVIKKGKAVKIVNGKLLLQFFKHDPKIRKRFQ